MPIYTATFTPTNVLEYVTAMVKQMPIDASTAVGIPYRLLNDTHSLIWHYAPWEWTIGELTTIPLAAGTVDYSVSSFPTSTFSRLQQAVLVDAGETFRPLAIRPLLHANPIKVGVPNEIAIVSAVNASWGIARVNPRPASSIPTSGNAQSIVMLYKKAMTVVASGNVGTATTFGCPDDFFRAYCSVALYFAFLYADDERAGSAIYEPKGDNYRYTGQRAVAEADLQDLAKRWPVLRVLETQADMLATRG